MTLDKDCEWCGPASLYKDKEKHCKDCGGVKKSDDNKKIHPTKESG